MGKRGHRDRLHGVLGPGRLSLLTLALVAPASSVWLAFGAAYHLAGSRVVAAYAVAAVLYLLVMLCYAELGSRYPEAGGDYALARHTLGPRAAAVYAAVIAVKGAVLPAALCLGAAGYLHDVWPGSSQDVFSVALLAGSVALGLMAVTASSRVMAVMVGVEALAFVILIVATVAAPPGPVAFRLASLVPTQAGDWASILAAAVPALYAYNGAQAVLYYSEETKAEPRAFGHLILTVAVATILVEGLGVTLATLALGPHPDLSATPLPLLGLVGRVGGRRLARVILAATAVALFDAAAATLMGYGRLFYAIARDGLWPRAVNRRFLRLNAASVPAAPIMVLGALNFGALWVSSLNTLIVLLGGFVLLLYGGIAWGALTSRRGPPAPYRMPLWPWPPLLVLASLGALLHVLPRSQLFALGAVTLGGLLWAWRKTNVDP
jgi:amino acid transporter